MEHSNYKILGEFIKLMFKKLLVLFSFIFHIMFGILSIYLMVAGAYYDKGFCILLGVILIIGFVLGWGAGWIEIDRLDDIVPNNKVLKLSRDGETYFITIYGVIYWLCCLLIKSLFLSTWEQAQENVKLNNTKNRNTLLRPANQNNERVE